MRKEKKKLFLFNIKISKQKLAYKTPEELAVSVLGKRLAPPGSTSILLVIPRLLGLDKDYHQDVQR